MREELIFDVGTDITKGMVGIDQLAKEIDLLSNHKVQIDIQNMTAQDFTTMASYQQLSGKMPTSRGGGGKEEEGGLTGMMKGINSGFKDLLMPISLMAGGVAILAEASGFFKAELTILSRAVGLIIKPLGDILGVGLMPIIDILMPIGRWFNAMMKPYMDKARAAMRAGNEEMKAGNETAAMNDWLIGGQYMMKGLSDAILTGVSQLPSLIMGMLGDALVSTKIPGLTDLGAGLSYAAEVVQGGLGEVTDGFIKLGDDYLNSKLSDALIHVGAVTNTTSEDMTKKFNALGLDTSSLSLDFTTAKTDLAGFTGTVNSYMADVNSTTNQNQMSSFVASIGNMFGLIVDEANSYESTIQSILSGGKTMQGQATNPIIDYAKQATANPADYYNNKIAMGGNQTQSVVNNAVDVKIEMNTSGEKLDESQLADRLSDVLYYKLASRKGFGT